MAYGKTKTLAAAAVLAAIPLSMQWSENAQLRRDLASRSSPQTTSPVAAPLAEVPPEVSLPNRASEKPLAEASVEGAGQVDADPSGLPAVPGLQGEGMVFPLPFEDVPSLVFNPLGEDGSLTSQMTRLLRLSNQEVEDVNATLASYRQKVWQHEKETVIPLAVSDEQQIYRIDAFPEFGAELKDEMKTAFDELLGPERSEFLGNRFFGVNEANRKFGLFGERHRTLTFKPQEDGRIRINIKEESPENDSTMSYTNYHDEVPEEFRHLFQVEESGEQ